MPEYPEAPPPEWDLGEWEKVLTIKVGRAYVCRGYVCGMPATDDILAALKG